MHGLNLYRKRNLQWFSKLVDGNFMKTCKERIAFRWFTGMMPGTVPCHLWKLYRRRPISIMSKIYSADLRGLQSTLLLKESYPSFDECIQHDSLRIESPLLQRSLTIHKYIPLRFLLVLLREQMLIFRQVSSWEDPYENFFLKQHFVQPGHSDPYVSVENLTKGLYGMSWTSQEETDSLWRIYSPDKMSVRISSTVENLVETVCSEDDKWDVWVNAVQYKSYEEITEWLGQIKTIKEREQFMEKMNESFFIKRKAFEAEKEYRLVVNYAEKISPTVCFHCEPQKLITDILVDPRVNVYEFEAVKASLLFFGVKEERIRKSELYSFQPQKVEMEYDLFRDF